MTTPRPNRLAVHVSVVGLYTLFFFSTFSTAGYNVALALLLLATLLSAKPFLINLHKTPLFILISLLTLYVLLRSLAALNQTPELATESDPHWTHHLRTTGAISIVIGWWLFQSAKHLPTLITLAIAGLFVGVLYDGNLSAIVSLEFSDRTLWGYQPNYLGLIAGIACLILISRGLLTPTKKNSRITLALTTIACLLSLLMVLTSQSRAAWLGLAVSLPILVLLYIECFNSCTRKASFIHIAKLSAPLVLFAFLAFYFYGDLALDRLTQQKDGVTHLLSGQLNEAAATGGAIGKRIAAWLIGVETILAYPFFGAGPSTSSQLLTSLDIAHFHNIYLEIIVSFGLVGALLYLSILSLFIYYLFKAHTQNLISARFFVTLITVTIFVAIFLFFSIRIGQPGGRATLNILGALYMFAFLTHRNAWKSLKGNNI